MGREGASVFFHVISHRYDKGAPTLVTSNRGLPGWGEVFGDDVLASAVLDRLVHRAVVFNIRGKSWRMKEHQALQEASRSAGDGGHYEP
jgi:DNA replication protein DnaC